jgi:hypothetical protein
MPGFDGTGPAGLGPMTGGCRGYCILKVDDKPGEPVKGFAGLQGRPVCRFPGSIHTDLASLHAQLGQISAMIRTARIRIKTLETRAGR